MAQCWFRLSLSFNVTSQNKLRTIAHVGTLYQPLRGRFAEQIGGDNIN